MALKIGYLDGNGHPCIKVSIWGLARAFSHEFEAMIDTGFTGFLSIPISSAFPLGLTLYGTTTYTLADGSASPKLLGFGTVAIEAGTAGEEAAHGVIVLEANSSGLLLGMDFLHKLNKSLIVTKSGVWLIDEPASTTATTAPAPKAPAPAPEEPNSGE